MSTSTLDHLIDITQAIDTHCDEMQTKINNENFLITIESLQSLLDKRQQMIEAYEVQEMASFPIGQREKLVQLDIAVSKKINTLFSATAEKMLNLRSQKRASEGYKVNANLQGSFLDIRN